MTLRVTRSQAAALVSGGSAGPSTAPSHLEREEALETAIFWKSQYQEVNPERYLQRRVQLASDTRPGIDVINDLPDLQKPHLPAGFIWHKDQNTLRLLKHKNAPKVRFQINIYGPDENRALNVKRTQYIASENGWPVYVFAMTKQEGFRKDFRGSFPISSDHFREGSDTRWRGHLIDYDFTLDTGGSTQHLSTFDPTNYVPEREGFMACSGRKQITRSTMEGHGAYSQIMLYGNTPRKTNGGVPIAEAVFMETFSYTRQRIDGYYIPDNHECHRWKANGVRGFSKKALPKLLNPDSFTAIVLHRLNDLEKTVNTFKAVPSNPDKLDVKDAYHLRRSAEVEHSMVEFKLAYVIYGKCNNDHVENLEFWLGRAVEMAILIDKLYESKRPSFPPAMMTTLSCHFTHLESPKIESCFNSLSQIAQKVTIATFRIDRVSTPKGKEKAPSHEFLNESLNESIIPSTEKKVLSSSINSTPSSSRHFISSTPDTPGKPIVREVIASASIGKEPLNRVLFNGDFVSYSEKDPLQSRFTHQAASSTSLIRERQVIVPQTQNDKMPLNNTLRQVLTAPITHVPAPREPAPREIVCLGTSPRVPEKLNKLRAEIFSAISAGQQMILKGVSSEMGNIILPEIKKAASLKSPHYKPIRQITVCTPRFLANIEKLTRTLFGHGVIVD